MLKKILSLGVVLASASGFAFGAASVRSMNPSSVGATVGNATTGTAATTRAGTLRVGGTGALKSSGPSTTRTSVSSGASGDSGRLATLAGAPIKTGKSSMPLSASASALQALEQRVKELRENVDTLGGRYNDLSAGLSESQNMIDEHTGKFADVEANIVDLSTAVDGMYTKGQIDSKFDSLHIPEGVDLRDFVQKTSLATELAVDANKAAVKGIIDEEGYAKTDDLDFLCDNPTFSATRIEGQDKARVTVSCGGNQKAEFEVPVGSDQLCKPTVTGPSEFDETPGASNTYIIGNTCDSETTELTIRNGTSGSAGYSCQSQVTTKKCGPSSGGYEIQCGDGTNGDTTKTGVRIATTDCNNSNPTYTYLYDIPGKDCLSQVITAKCGPRTAGYDVECADETKTGLVITKTDCDGNATGTPDYIYDLDEPDPVCAPVIKSEANASDSNCEDIISQAQKWDGTKCVDDSTQSAVTTTVCNGEPGKPLNYLGNLSSCDDLESKTGASGDFYIVEQESTSLMCVYNGTNWPTCPDGCNSLGQTIGVDTDYTGVYTVPTANHKEPGKLTLTMTINGQSYTIYNNHKDSCGDIEWGPSGAKYYDGTSATGMVQKCTVQWMPSDTENKPSVTEYYISASDNMKWVYHATDGNNPGFIVKHKMQGDTVADEVGSHKPDDCGTLKVAKAFNDRFLLNGGQTCTVKNWGPSYNVDYNTSFNPKPLSVGDTYTIGANNDECYTSAETYEKPKKGDSTNCGAEDNPCTTRGYTQTVYTAADPLPGGCSSSLPGAPDPEYDYCYVKRIGNRTEASNNIGGLYECVRGVAAPTDAGTTYYWSKEIASAATVKVYHEPDCTWDADDSAWVNCKGRGYIAEHEAASVAGATSDNMIPGTSQEDYCDGDNTNIASVSGEVPSRGLVTKCTVRSGASVGGYPEGFDANTRYSVGVATPIPCVATTTSYIEPERDANQVIINPGYTLTTSKDLCGGTDPDPIIKPDQCEMKNVAVEGEGNDRSVNMIMSCKKQKPSDPTDPTGTVATYELKEKNSQIARVIQEAKEKAEAAEAKVCDSYAVEQDPDNNNEPTLFCVKDE